MKLSAYVIDGHRIDIRPAPIERAWMDLSPRRFAYRCLPLNIANAHGWEILCPADFVATWSGGPGQQDIQIQAAGTDAQPPAVSHFGVGVLTFHIPCLFRTEPGYDLVVQGPINRPKDAIAPLTGVIETDWAPYTFTMNWKFTRPRTPVSFARGEAFCHIFPMKRGELETVEPQLRSLADAPQDLKRQFDDWSQSRLHFNADLKRADSEASAEGWQKHYYHGQGTGATESPIQDHRTRLRLRPFSA